MTYSAPFNLAIIAAIFGLGSTAQASAGQAPAVVELFTSQGCSSCPPANANLVRLSNDPDVLALSFSVTYWDYLGWKDIFGKKEFTERQVTYEPALGQSGPFTPQMVVNGHQSTVGYDLNQIRRVIASEPALSGPGIALAPNVLSSTLRRAGALRPTSGSSATLRAPCRFRSPEARMQARHCRTPMSCTN